MHDYAGRRTDVSNSGRTLRWILLPIIMLAAMAVYYPIARQNLPVALNVDDRTSLGVLLRFHQGSANPNFFMYPTLYYYLTYAAVAGFGFSRILLTGHLFNLCLLGLTAWLSGLFCLRQFKSRGASLVAAVCVFFSPSLVSSGAYLCTDVLLSAMTILSLDLLMTYFRTRTSRDWLYAMLAVSCAAAAKYTAAVLFIAYAVGEVVFVLRDHSQASSNPSEAPRFRRSIVYAALFVSGALAALVAIFFPVQAILHFVALHRTNLATRSTQDYLVFLNKLRRLAVELSILAFGMLLAAWRSKRFYEAVSLKRLYYGVLVMAGVFVMTTPYSVLDPAKFIYDMGALMRANVVVIGNHQQWNEYWHWLFDSENRAFVILGIFGLGLMMFRLSWIALTPIAFAVIHVVAICTAHRGFPRYLDPLLPLLYCGTALTARELWGGFAKTLVSGKGQLLWRGAMCLAASAVLFQVVITTIQHDRAASDHTAFYSAYVEVMKDAPLVKAFNQVPDATSDREHEPVLYAGFAPSIELDLAGLKTREVSWTSLSNGPIGDQLQCNQILILNEKSAAANHLSAGRDNSLDILLDDPRGEGQMVVRRKGCDGTNRAPTNAPL